MMKHYSHVANFANLDFEAIDTEILTDKANEKEGETIAGATKVTSSVLLEVKIEVIWFFFFLVPF